MQTIKMPGTDSIFGFLSIHADQKKILLWLVDCNKIKTNQPWPNAQDFYMPAYNVLSLFYTIENDYVIIIYFDEFPTGTFRLHAYTKKLTFNAFTSPNSYTSTDGNTNIITKDIIDTFTALKQINGYSSTGNDKGVFQIILDKEVYSYHWDFVSGNQNLMLRYLMPNPGTPTIYLQFIVNRPIDYTTDSVFVLSYLGTDFYFGLAKINVSSCVGLLRDLEPGKCFSDCPDYEEYDFTNKICRDCASYYSGTKNYILFNKCYASCQSLAVGANNICATPVCAEGTYLSNITSNCETSCPTYVVANTFSRSCDNCKLLSLGFSYNNVCVAGSTCPANTYLADSSTNGCLACASPNYFDPTTST